MATQYTIALSTCPDSTVAETIASALVEESLAACVNIIPNLTSIYRWQGKTEKDNEVLMLIKTQTDLFSALSARIKEMHPYELPEVIAVSITNGLSDYLDWVRDNTKDDNREK
jgi:periplasmic divalent cation tolerance protein